MNQWNHRLAAVVVVVSIIHVRVASAQDPACASRISRGNIAPCVLRASLSVRAERAAGQAVEGRYAAASPLLPANPVLSVSGGRRIGTAAEGTAFNWYASLAQEIEIGGQRGARRDAVVEERTAQSRRIALSERETALAAWQAFYEVLAAEETLALSARLQGTSQATAAIARARASSGLLSPVEADVAEAVSLRLGQARLGAERRARVARTSLAAMLGLDPGQPPSIEGDLAPPPGVEAAARALASGRVPERLEVQALEADRRALDARATVFRRARVPNPTLSVFVQNDGFNERVFGGGIAVPIPLPGGVGRTYSGDIAESEALALQRGFEAEQLRREHRLDATTALHAYESRRAEVVQFTPERLARAEQALSEIARELESGRLALRDVIVSQQTLIELLVASVEARRAFALAALDLARAAGVALERGAR